MPPLISAFSCCSWASRDGIIDRESRRHGVRPERIRTVIQIESASGSRARWDWCQPPHGSWASPIRTTRRRPSVMA